MANVSAVCGAAAGHGLGGVASLVGVLRRQPVARAELRRGALSAAVCGWSGAEHPPSTSTEARTPISPGGSSPPGEGSTGHELFSSVRTVAACGTPGPEYRRHPASNAAIVPPSSYADSVSASDTSPIASSTSYPCFQPSAPVIDSTDRTAPVVS